MPVRLSLEAVPTARAAAGVTAFCATLWGTSFIVNDLGLDVLDPAAFTFWRFALAAAVSVTFAALTKNLPISVFLDPAIWFVAALNTAAFLLQYYGQTLTTPARAALFINSNVLVVAALSWVLLRERPRKRTVVAMAIALFGVVLLQTRGSTDVLLTGSPTGDLVVFLSGTSAALMFVLFPAAMERHGVVPLMAALFLLSAAFAAPVAFATAPAATLAPDPRGLWAIAYAAIVTSSFAYTLWAFALAKLTPTISAVILLLEVLVAAAASVAIGRDAFTLITAFGAILLMGGVVWLSLLPPVPKPQQA